MGAVTSKGLLELLGEESNQWAQINSCAVVSEEGLEEVLGNPTVNRDPYFLHDRIGEGGRTRNDRGGPYGTGGDHVGRNLNNKFRPEGLDHAGPDPMRDRHFVADEFQGMLMYGPDGNPAFWSLFPEGTPPEERTVLKINIATKIPDYVLDPKGTIKPALDARKDSAFAGQTLEEAFTPVDERVIAQIRKYAEGIEKTFGIKLDIQVDRADDPHITVMGFTNGSPGLAGFASFPKAMRGWERLEPYSHTPGFMCLNMDYIPTISDKQVHDLFAHEFGHSIGWAHPHDLALFRRLSSRDALTLTTMSYSDLEYTPFEGKGGAELGALDYYLRKWLANPPVLSEGNGVYDLDQQHRLTFERNKDTLVFRREKLLPVLPMIAHGRNNVLRGTAAGNDFLDTNPGYLSHITHPDTGATQKFLLVEGHLETVMGIAGNNTIIASQSGNQEILPGIGQNEIRFLYPAMQGVKTIISEGNDTLVLSEALFRSAPAIHARTAGDDVVLSFGECKIRLQGHARGQGVSNLRVVDAHGQTILEKPIQELSAREIHTHVFWPAQKAIAKAEEDRQQQTKPSRTSPRKRTSGEPSESAHDGAGSEWAERTLTARERLALSSRSR